MRESEIEQHFIWTVQRLGGRTYKFKSVNNRGVADRIVGFAKALAGHVREALRRHAAQFIGIRPAGHDRPWHNDLLVSVIRPLHGDHRDALAHALRDGPLHGVVHEGLAKAPHLHFIFAGIDAERTVDGQHQREQGQGIDRKTEHREKGKGTDQ